MVKKVWLASHSTFTSPSFTKKLLNFAKYLLTGEGFDSYIHEASLFRLFLRKPIPYKIICKVAQISSRKYIENPKTYSTNDDSLVKTIDYTLTQNKQNKVYGSSRRMQTYYHLSEVFQTKPLSECNILIVGPKFIVELILAWTYGFKWKNIDAIDLIQCHPKIKLANVDDFSSRRKYDVIVMSNVFGYNNNPDGCLASLSSALKEDGLLVYNSAFMRDHANIDGIAKSSMLTSSELKNKMCQKGLSVLAEIIEEKDLSISTIWVAKNHQISSESMIASPK